MFASWKYSCQDNCQYLPTNCSNNDDNDSNDENYSLAFIKESCS